MKPYALLLLSLLAACTGTAHSIDHEEKGEAWDGKPRANLLVIGMYEEKTDRVSIESVLAARLSEQGIQAKPSYDIVPNLDESLDSIRYRVRGKGYDAVLTMATLEGGEEFDYESHQASYAFVRLLGSEGTFTRLGGYAEQAESAAHVLDIGLWDARSLKPIWNATTDSTESDIGPDGIKRFADWLAGELRSRQLTN